MNATFFDRAISCLQRGREVYDDLVHAAAVGHTPAKLISQCQNAAEFFFKAILYSRNIRIEKTHEIQNVARKWRGNLVDIWQQLEPLCEVYDWLFPERIIADYQHADAPAMSNYTGVSEPPIPIEDVEKAMTEVYDWLLPKRIEADYPHADAPAKSNYAGISEPPIPMEKVEKAMEAVHQLKCLAEEVVEY